MVWELIFPTKFDPFCGIDFSLGWRFPPIPVRTLLKFVWKSSPSFHWFKSSVSHHVKCRNLGWNELRHFRRIKNGSTFCHWESPQHPGTSGTAQEAIFIGGTWHMFLAYVREYPHKIYIVQYLTFRVLNFPLICVDSTMELPLSTSGPMGCDEAWCCTHGCRGGFSGQTQTDSMIQGLWKKHMQPQQGGVSKNVIKMWYCHTLSYFYHLPIPNHFNRDTDTDNQPVLITGVASL